MTTTTSATGANTTRIELDPPSSCTIDQWLDLAMPAFCGAVADALKGGADDVLLELCLPFETRSSTTPIKGYMRRRIYVTVQSLSDEPGVCFIEGKKRLDAEHGLCMRLADSEPPASNDRVLREWLRMIAMA